MALIRNRRKTRFFRNLANKNIQAFEQKAHEILIVAVYVMRSDELTKLPAPTSRIVIIAVRTFFLSFVGSWHNIGYSAIFHGCLNVFRRGFQPLYINRIAFFFLRYFQCYARRQQKLHHRHNKMCCAIAALHNLITSQFSSTWGKTCRHIHTYNEQTYEAKKSQTTWILINSIKML